MLPKSGTLNDVITLILRYFTEFGIFGAHCIKVVDGAITMDSYDYYV